MTGVSGDVPPEVPEGHGFDFINLDGLLNHVTVAPDGGLLTTGGSRYRLLCLGGTSHRMTLTAVRRITELLDAGATVAGWRPESTPSRGDHADDWTAAVEKIWAARAGLLDLAGVPASDGVAEGQGDLQEQGSLRGTVGPGRGLALSCRAAHRRRQDCPRPPTGTLRISLHSPAAFWYRECWWHGTACRSLASACRCRGSLERNVGGHIRRRGPVAIGTHLDHPCTLERAGVE